jgi:hypothetical protein
MNRHQGDLLFGRANVAGAAAAFVDEATSNLKS